MAATAVTSSSPVPPPVPKPAIVSQNGSSSPAAQNPYSGLARLKQVFANLRAAQNGPVESFIEKYSWNATFAPIHFLANGHIINGAQPRNSEDGEPDDLFSFMNLLQNLSAHMRKTGIVLRVNVTVREGLRDLLDQKIDTLQIILCHMVVEGMIDPRCLKAVHFYRGIEREADPEKLPGYEGIHKVVCDFLLTPEVETLVKQLRDSQSEQILDQEFDAIFSRSDLAPTGLETRPSIREFSTAPIDDQLERNPDWDPHTSHHGYGAFNYHLTSTRGIDKNNTDAVNKRAKAVEDRLGRYGDVHDFEGFLATLQPRRDGNGQVVRDKDGNPSLKDFNRIGFRDSPELFGPLVAPGASRLQQCVLAIIEAWSKPSLDRLRNDFAKVKVEVDVEVSPGVVEKQTLFKGREFFEVLEKSVHEAIATGSEFTLGDAEKLAKTYFSDATFAQMKNKLKLSHHILSNQCREATLSDLTATLLKDPDLARDLIDPDCVSQSRVTLKYANKRVNVTFVPDPAGNALAIQSRWNDDPTQDRTGLRIARLKTAVVDFFTSLKPQPAVAQSQNRHRAVLRLTAQD